MDGLTNQPAHRTEESSQNTQQPSGQHLDVSYCYLYLIKTGHCLVSTSSAHRSEKDPMIGYTLRDYSNNSVGSTAEHDQMGPRGMLRQVPNFWSADHMPRKKKGSCGGNHLNVILLALARRGTDAERRVMATSLRRLTSIRCTSICVKPQLFTHERILFFWTFQVFISHLANV